MSLCADGACVFSTGMNNDCLRYRKDVFTVLNFIGNEFECLVGFALCQQFEQRVER